MGLLEAGAAPVSFAFSAAAFFGTTGVRACVATSGEAETGWAGADELFFRAAAFGFAGMPG